MDEDEDVTTCDFCDQPAIMIQYENNQAVWAYCLDHMTPKLRKKYEETCKAASDFESNNE